MGCEYYEQRLQARDSSLVTCGIQELFSKQQKQKGQMKKIRDLEAQ